VQPYLATARAFRFVLAAMLVVVWGAGLAAAVVEYKSTYQSEATVWAVRAAPALSVTDPDDPNIAVIQTAASQQAEVLKQFLQTRSFLVDVVGRTPLKASYEAAADPDKFIDDVRKRFRVETLGTSLIRVSFVAHDPNTPPDLINAALVVRAERLDRARQLSSAALGLLLQSQIEFAQQKALDAQKALDEFNQSHREPLSEPDQHVRAQLRLNLDFALVGLSDLQGRMTQSALAPALLEVSGVEFQVVDEPLVATTPRGGERAAMTIAAVALAAGAGLTALLVLIATLLGLRGPRARTAAADRVRSDAIPSVVATSSTARR
jgi:uncharacterized protein involved in exopolysaccharide biosynthesis